ncbi:hypothetical protein NMY3_01553 [Candidatus Nitrosocosmicus oleophilus]|uniref:Uncharacterized protein n=1 Tax=Candidatus Nitrosocosmicus oleophilus TaxID=1353260 RepID=A0A654LZA0_9ARCH|nr:hypothetical protein NMY3_01553 [Candidatus Nitrosocosmicus oleophilus]
MVNARAQLKKTHIMINHYMNNHFLLHYETNPIEMD